MGCSDELTLYRCFCSSYKPVADDAQTGCPISQVFADLQPEPLAQQGKHRPLDYDRTTEAQQCGIQSTLLLPVYEFDAQSPSCVFELAQQQPDVDFTLAVQILQNIAEVGRMRCSVDSSSSNCRTTFMWPNLLSFIRWLLQGPPAQRCVQWHVEAWLIECC